MSGEIRMLEAFTCRLEFCFCEETGRCVPGIGLHPCRSEVKRLVPDLAFSSPLGKFHFLPLSLGSL